MELGCYKIHSSNLFWERTNAGAGVNLSHPTLRDRGCKAEGSFWQVVRMSRWGSGSGKTIGLRYVFLLINRQQKFSSSLSSEDVAT